MAGTQEWVLGKYMSLSFWGCFSAPGRYLTIIYAGFFIGLQTKLFGFSGVRCQNHPQSTTGPPITFFVWRANFGEANVAKAAFQCLLRTFGCRKLSACISTRIWENYQISKSDINPTCGKVLRKSTNCIRTWNRVKRIRNNMNNLGCPPSQ